MSSTTDQGTPGWIEANRPATLAPDTMTGARMKAVRKSLGMSVLTFARALGYKGQDDTVSLTVRRYESNGRPIPPWIARLVEMYNRYGVPF